VSPLRGEKPQNRPLSKLNTGRFALRAMLPVMNAINKQIIARSETTSCDVCCHANTQDSEAARTHARRAHLQGCTQSNPEVIRTRK